MIRVYACELAVIFWREKMWHPSLLYYEFLRKSRGGKKRAGKNSVKYILSYYFAETHFRILRLFFC